MARRGASYNNNIITGGINHFGDSHSSGPGALQAGIIAILTGISAELARRALDAAFGSSRLPDEAFNQCRFFQKLAVRAAQSGKVDAAKSFLGEAVLIEYLKQQPANKMNEIIDQVDSKDPDLLNSLAEIYNRRYQQILKPIFKAESTQNNDFSRGRPSTQRILIDNPIQDNIGASPETDTARDSVENLSGVRHLQLTRAEDQTPAEEEASNLRRRYKNELQPPSFRNYGRNRTSSPTRERSQSSRSIQEASPTRRLNRSEPLPFTRNSSNNVSTTTENSVDSNIHGPRAQPTPVTNTKRPSGLRENDVISKLNVIGAAKNETRIVSLSFLTITVSPENLSLTWIGPCSRIELIRHKEIFEVLYLQSCELACLGFARCMLLVLTIASIVENSSRSHVEFSPDHHQSWEKFRERYKKLYHKQPLPGLRALVRQGAYGGSRIKPGIISDGLPTAPESDGGVEMLCCKRHRIWIREHENFSQHLFHVHRRVAGTENEEAHDYLENLLVADAESWEESGASAIWKCLKVKTCLKQDDNEPSDTEENSH